MLERLPRGKRNLVLLGLGIVLAWFCWTIRSVLNPLLLGYLFAFILHPFVVAIEKRGFSRRTAVNLTFVAGFASATVLGVVLVLQTRALAIDALEGRPAVEGGAAVEGAAEPERRTARERLQARLDEFTGSLNERFGLDLHVTLPSFEGLGDTVSDFLREHGDSVQKAAGAGLEAAGRGFAFVSRVVGKVLSIAGLFVLVPIYTYYLLFQLDRIGGFLRRYLPHRDRERIADTAEKIGQVIANFFRGRLLVCLLKGLFLSLGLWVADIEYFLLLGMLSGFLSIIPFFGPFIGFLAAFLVGMIGDHAFVSALVRTGIVFGLGELLEGYVLLPKILGDSLGLHPLVVLFAIFAGGAAMGMLGILIALPLAASIVIVVQEFVLPAMREFADET